MSTGQLSISFDVKTVRSLQQFFDALELEARAFLEREIGASPPIFSLQTDRQEHFFRQPDLTPHLAVMEGQPLALTMDFMRDRDTSHAVQEVQVRGFRSSPNDPIKLSISFTGTPIGDVATFRDAARSHFTNVIKRITGAATAAGPETISGDGRSVAASANVATSLLDKLDQAPRAGVSRIPRIFVSYSHDSPEHKAWVAQLARRLNSLAIWLLFDQWDVELGGDLPRFMEAGITDSDRILVICTAAYNDKANNGRGGAGYEKMIMTAALMQDQSTARIVPVVRGGHRPSTPTFLASRRYIDFTRDDTFEASLDDLSRDLLFPRAQRPLFGA